MVATAMKHMASNFANLDKFKEAYFKRWQKKIHFLLSNMSVVYVLTTPIPEDGKNATVDQIRRRNKLDNDEYVCRGLILKGMSNPLFDIYQNVESRKELYDSLETKYMAEDDQVRSSLFTQHKMNMDEAIQISYVINKLPFSWKYFKHTLKHNMKELTLVELGSHLRIEESLRAHHSDKPKGNNIVGPHNNDEMDSIMSNNTWVLADLPPSWKPLGCKWIFKIKLKTAVCNGINSQSDYSLDGCEDSFLNGELDEEVYMNQPQGFIMHGNQNKVCKQIKSLYRLKHSPKQWHQKFNEVVLSNGYLLNQAGKYVYSKFDEFGKGVIICLYVDDMLIFGTDQVQVDLSKEILSSRFSMKDINETKESMI
nr:hypothetical protein [Tanacetum cinerariifolium]